MSIALLDNEHLFKTDGQVREPVVVTVSLRRDGVTMHFAFSSHRTLEVWRRGRSWTAERSVKLATGGRFHQRLSDPKTYGSAQYTDMDRFIEMLAPWLEDEFGVLGGTVVASYVHEVSSGLEKLLYKRGTVTLPTCDFITLAVQP